MEGRQGQGASPERRRIEVQGQHPKYSLASFKSATRRRTRMKDAAVVSLSVDAVEEGKGATPRRPPSHRKELRYNGDCGGPGHQAQARSAAADTRAVAARPRNLPMTSDMNGYSAVRSVPGSDHSPGRKRLDSLSGALLGRSGEHCSLFASSQSTSRLNLAEVRPFTSSRALTRVPRSLVRHRFSLPRIWRLERTERPGRAHTLPHLGC